MRYTNCMCAAALKKASRNWIPSRVSHTNKSCKVSQNPQQARFLFSKDWKYAVGMVSTRPAGFTSIHDYITHDSPIRAWKFVQRLGTATLSLQTFPLMGRPVPEVIDNADIILELIFRNYRIIYRVIPDESIQIITVLHASRDLNNLQNQPWLTQHKSLHHQKQKRPD